MKAVQFKDGNAYCPHCHQELERMVPCGVSKFQDENQVFMAGLDHLEFTSVNNHSQHHKAGSFFFCSNCQELIFGYSEQDCRVCSNCPHFGKVKYKNRRDNKIEECSGCTWYNVSFGTEHTLGSYKSTWQSIQENADTRHCSHIDDIKKELDSRMACKFCKYYHKETKSGSFDTYYTEYKCLASEPYHVGKQRALETQVGICQEFVLSYEAYKKYRAQFDGLLIIPDDAIIIPEFEERIKQEEKENA